MQLWNLHLYTIPFIVDMKGGTYILADINIGERIKNRRKELGISVAKLAGVTGLSKATLHRYENGDIKRIKLPTIECIATYLNVNPLWLIGKSDVKSKSNADNELDLDAMLNYTLKAIRTSTVVYKGKDVPDNVSAILDQSIELCITILEKSI